MEAWVILAARLCDAALRSEGRKWTYSAPQPLVYGVTSPSLTMSVPSLTMSFPSSTF